MARGNLKIENYLPYVLDNKGIYSAYPIYSSAGLNGPSSVTTTTAATVALTAANTGAVYFATASSGTQTFTLPAVAAGLEFTFICGHASGEILINPTGSVVITIQTFSAVGADADTAIVATAAGTGIKNTAATNAISNSVTLISDGTGWYSKCITSGIWASQ